MAFVGQPVAFKGFTATQISRPLRHETLKLAWSSRLCATENLGDSEEALLLHLILQIKKLRQHRENLGNTGDVAREKQI